MKTRKFIRKAKRAFTLFEILIVIGLIALLVAFLVPNFDKLFTSGQVSMVKSTVDGSYSAPLMAYKLAMGRYPTTEEGLIALIRAPESAGSKWKGPYIKGSEVPSDPWGKPYQYLCPGVHNKDSYDLWSFGPDGVASDDDIGNW